MARLGSIIAGAMGGAGEQAVEVADRALEKRDLLEASKAELTTLTYEHELDMRKLREERKLESGDVTRTVTGEGGKVHGITRGGETIDLGITESPMAGGRASDRYKVVGGQLFDVHEQKWLERPDSDQETRALAADIASDMYQTQTDQFPAPAEPKSYEDFYHDALRILRSAPTGGGGARGATGQEGRAPARQSGQQGKRPQPRSAQFLKQAIPASESTPTNDGSRGDRGGKTYVGKDRSGKTIAVTWQMIQETAQKHGKTPEQVISDLNLQPQQ